MCPFLPLSHAHHNRVEPGLVNPGSTQFYEFRSHVPVSRALCYLGNCENGVPRQSVGSDPFHLSAATAKARTEAQYSSVKGDSQRKACGTFSLRQKQRRTFFLAATLSYLARATSAVRTIWVKPRNHTSL